MTGNCIYGLKKIFWQSADLKSYLEVNLGHKYFKETMLQKFKIIDGKADCVKCLHQDQP